MKYADDLVLLAMEETVLQSMINALTELGRCFGTEMNVDATKVMRISTQPFPTHIMTDQKQLEKCEMLFNPLGGITNAARRTCKIKPRTAMAKAAFSRKTFHQQIGFKFKEETSKMLQLENNFVWCCNLDTWESRSEIQGDTKKQELLKNPTKIEEIQEKKFIDRN